MAWSFILVLNRKAIGVYVKLQINDGKTEALNLLMDGGKAE